MTYNFQLSERVMFLTSNTDDIIRDIACDVICDVIRDVIRDVIHEGRCRSCPDVV